MLLFIYALVFFCINIARLAKSTEEISDPKSLKCGINEIASDCRQICPPQDCYSRIDRYKCQSNITCEPGCDCVPNYLRNEDGVCAPVDECDKFSDTCNGDPNAVYEDCRSSCLPTCDQPDVSDKVCIACDSSGCACKPGFILFKKGYKCVLPEDCLSLNKYYRSSLDN